MRNAYTFIRAHTRQHRWRSGLARSIHTRIHTSRTRPCICIETNTCARVSHRHVCIHVYNKHIYIRLCTTEYNIWLNVKQNKYTYFSEQSCRREFGYFFLSISFVRYFPQQNSQYHWIVVYCFFLYFCNIVSVAYREFYLIISSVNTVSFFCIASTILLCSLSLLVDLLRLPAKSVVYLP